MNSMKYAFLLLMLLFGVSCNYLDVDESTGKEEAYMYGYFDEVKKIVTNIYGYLPDDFGTIDGALRECATDNAVHVWSDSSIHGFYDGRWSAVNPIDNVWPTYYEAIRAANLFLATFNLDNFDKFSNNEDYENLMKMAAYYPYEVRFLRAFYYFELIKRYKDVPLVLDVLTPEEANTQEQVPFEKVVEFIVDECDAAADVLPESYANLPSAERGRITKGACMALKSRVLLYAASPLFNGGVDVEAKYKRAVDAAWDLIALATKNNLYSIMSGEVLWGNGNTVLNSKQLILERRNAASNAFEKKNFPIGYEGGNTGTCPTQNLVDAFEWGTGADFSWDNATMAAAPYSNRNPRLAQTVLYNGATWKNEVVETFYGGRNAQPLSGATLTGYYLKKFLVESISLKAGNATTQPHHYILFRYAEILMNYAEAMTEWRGHNYTDETYTMSAIDAVNKVRERSNSKAIPVTISEANFRIKYRNDRRVEFAFEDHRFWDLRRWKIGPETTDIYGISIKKDESGKLTYERVLVQKRIWDDKMYLYPIPQAELLKNPSLVQNPGW